ncbi:class I SAM-dependent methyltransferase [Candidatus Kaiserbacteria bacterium]|nr:MAG: class I SAM-dependent methyltransferase [Candidatus Kaiserbacteria bacterium]
MEPHARNNATAHINVGGKDINVTIDTTQTKAVGPMALAGGTKLPENTVSAQTRRESQGFGVDVNNPAFSDPKKNVKRLGFREGMKVADFGSGSGAYTLALVDVVGQTGVVYSVDIQKDLLTRTQNAAVQKGYENIEIVWGDIESVDGVKLKDGLLDGVLLSNTLFQVDDKINTIKEAYRVLKPGGILAIIDWNESYGGIGPPEQLILTPAEANLICNDNGFVAKGTFDAGEHHYGLLFKKAFASDSQRSTSQEDFISRTVAQELI